MPEKAPGNKIVSRGFLRFHDGFSGFFQIFAAEIASQRLIKDQRCGGCDNDFRHHIGCVVGDGPNWRSPAQFVRSQNFPNDPAGNEVTGKTSQQRNDRTDCDGGVTIFNDAVKAGGKTDDAKGYDVVKQDNANCLPDILRILDIGKAQDHLDDGIDDSGKHTPFRAVTVCQDDKWQHAANGDAAAINLGTGKWKQA